MIARCGAILLAGGRATRLGGVDKPLLEVGGRTLLAAAVEAVRGCAPITVVGPSADLPDVRSVSWVREDPPFGGPAAAVVAALGSWDDPPPWTFVLACDLPGVTGAVARLRDAVALLPADTEGVCLADASSRPQWLTGLYRTDALQRTAAGLPDRGRDAPARALVSDLAVAAIAAPVDETHDVDTWEDLEEARRRFGDVALGENEPGERELVRPEEEAR